MQKTYIEAIYRIKNRVYNHGYICIDKDSTIGIFTFDRVQIDIKDGKIYLYLVEYDPENDCFHDSQQFIGGRDINTLESPYTYTLKSSNQILSFELIKRVTEPKVISDISKTFEKLLGK